MKQITVVLQPHRLEQVEQALRALPHPPGFTLYWARGHGRGRSADHPSTLHEWNPDAHDKRVILVFCSDEHAQPIVDAVRTAAHTGRSGDGVIAVSELTDLVRIRTGERGDAAA